MTLCYEFCILQQTSFRFNQSILNENEEPQVDKECAKVLTDQLSNESNPLPWFATDCQSLEVEGALCEMPDPNTQFPELEKLGKRSIFQRLKCIKFDNLIFQSVSSRIIKTLGT